MEWIWNSITGFLYEYVQPDFTNLASEPPLSEFTDKENVSDRRDAQNEQTMENYTNDDPAVSSTNETNEETFSKENTLSSEQPIVNLRNDDLTGIPESEEINAKTINLPTFVNVVSLRQDDPTTSSECELSRENESGEEITFQEPSIVNSKEDNSRESELHIEEPLQNQDSDAVNLHDDGLEYQHTEFKKLDDSIDKLVSKAVLVKTSKEMVTSPQGNTEHKFVSLLSDLKLNPQEKLTLKKAQTVDNYTFCNEALATPNEIPKYILKKLMIVDYRARAFKLDSEQSHEEDDDDDKEDKDTNGSVNPMDAFLAVFHCCDDFLRQDLATKLSACQLSVPFLLPDPYQPSEKITMLLWALEGVKKTWKTIKDDKKTFTDYQGFVTEHPFPIVSFIRIGENEISKSGLLNKVLSDVNGYHDFFFHKDCRGGGVERKIVDGLVEVCWYLPGGRKQQAFEREICLANLRGDAQKFRKQFSVLSKISSVMFLLLPSKYPDPSTQQILEEGIKAEGMLVLIFNKKRQGNAKQYFDDLKSANQNKLSSITRAVKRNEDDFVVAIRDKVRKNTQDFKLVVLSNLTSVANDYKILLDENGNKTKTPWRKNIEKWFTKGPKEAKMQLKLQLQIPTIANLERENVCPTRRGNKSEEEYSDEIYNKIQAARNSQKESIKQMKEEISKCLNHIPVMNENERNYSLTVLKHNMDKMSLEVLGSLQAEYRQTWFDSQKKKKDKRQQNDSNYPARETAKEPESVEESRLRELEEAIKESSFGLEHIFREMAQLFQLTEITTNNYAGAAAEILLSGQPLELMDGDSSYIPLRWFNAVFGKLQTYTNNANVFVISVLGIQSSGKSTMLNTMFGLEFAVSAGRCTRGAFASLIPLSDSLKHESRYDYLLVIDTEGLRGSADPQLRQHDNELSTFAIGVADLTIVNIFGENYNEMKEFLEIAVHAFLKMKLVKEKRICQIVHQNVAAVNAISVLATERITLKKKLDEMTKLAAIQENCECDFGELNDVLSFDENENVSYIPSLLQGCPPMAPMNPEYGEAIQQVKEKITKLMCLPERSPLSISQFKNRVNGLWNAILRENFIFSFRNTIEVRAFTSLDQKFFEESVKTMVTQMAELEKTITVSLMRSTADDREDIWKVHKLLIREKAEALAKEMEKEMEIFFETNEDKATLEQWRENIMIKIEQLKESQEAEVKKNCKATFDYLQSRQEIDKMKLHYEKKLLANAKEFITSVEATVDVNARREIFEQQWQQWIADVPDSPVKKNDVRQVMINILCNSNKQLDHPIHEKCKVQKFIILNFQKNRPSIALDKLKVGCLEKVKNFFRDNPTTLMDAEVIRDRAINSAFSFAIEKSRSGIRCRESDLKCMYHIICDTLHRETEKQPFKFQPCLIVDILLYSFANAYSTFLEMEDSYYRERDIKSKLEKDLKPKLQKYFLNLCTKMKKELLAASSLVDVLEKEIALEINRSMGPAVAREILKKNEFQSKGQFHAKVLIELGEKGTFSAYIDYLRDPVQFLKKQLQVSIENYCIHPTDFDVNSLLEKEIEKIKDKIFSAISIANKQVSSKGEGINYWIEQFVENCSALAITSDMFSVATIDEELKDFEVFENKVETDLKQIFQQVLDQGVDKSVFREWKPTPFDKLVDLMFGCDKCCPFCRVLCDQTLGNHESQHSTRIHRPQGITGYRYEHSNILVTTMHLHHPCR